MNQQRLVMFKVLSILEKLDRWTKPINLSNKESIESKQNLGLNIKLNQRNGNIGFDIFLNNELVSFELTNIGIAQLESILEDRKKL